MDLTRQRVISLITGHYFNQGLPSLSQVTCWCFDMADHF